jgi:hypothetical protein
MKKVFLLASCLVVGMLIGGILLLNMPLKWDIAIFGVMATTVSMLMVGNPKRILLFVLAFTVPIVFEKAFIVSQEFISLTNGTGINLSNVLVLMLLMLFLAKLASRQIEIHFYPWITIPALVWLIISSLSLLAAVDGQLVLFQLFNMFKLLLLAWAVASSVENKVDVTIVITGLVLGMCFQSVVGIYQGVTGHLVGLDFLGEKTTVMQQNLGEGSACTPIF